MLKYYDFLDALQPATARKLARENLLSIIPESPARLSDDESTAFNGRQPAGTELLKQTKAQVQVTPSAAGSISK